MRHLLPRAGARVRTVAALLTMSALLITWALGAPPAHAGGAASGDDLGTILLVVDASGSMKRPAPDGASRMEGAQSALKQLAAELPPGTSVGLRAFGEGAALSATPETCTDSRLVAPVAPLDPGVMAQAIDSIKPRGWTPIGHTLALAAADVAPATAATVVLVSDGLDTCFPDFGPEPCDVAKTYAGGPVDLQVHTIGLAVDEAARAQLECIAAATGGQYLAASDAASLVAALRASMPAPPAPRQLSPVVLTEPASPMDVSAAVVLFLFAAGGAGVATAVWAVQDRRRGRYW